MPKARYGYDAPGIMLGMLGGGGGVIGLGLVGLGFSGGGLLALACDAAIVLGCLPFSLGCLMVAYAVAGKGRMREAMMAAVDWSGDECVLDVGAGAGLLLIAAAKRLTTGSAVGVDIWSAKDLSANARATTLRNIEIEGVADRAGIETADARRLPMPDGRFDVVLSLLCIHNIEGRADQARALNEIARVLKPGGRALIADYLPTAFYADTLKDAGLMIVTNGPYFSTALSLMWMVIAEKPPEG